jgi:hypothetical protein
MILSDVPLLANIVVSSTMASSPKPSAIALSDGKGDVFSNGESSGELLTPKFGQDGPLPMKIEIPSRGPTPPMARPLPVRANATPSATSSGAQRVKRSGTITQKRSSKSSEAHALSSEDEGYEGDAAKDDDETDVAPDSPVTTKTALPSSRTQSHANGHSREPSSPGAIPRRTARSQSRGSETSFASVNRENFAKTRPFPTPGVKEPSCDPMDSYAYKSVEEERLKEDAAKKKHWKRWGPYLSERQWVRAPLIHAGRCD